MASELAQQTNWHGKRVARPRAVKQVGCPGARRWPDAEKTAYLPRLVAKVRIDLPPACGEVVACERGSVLTKTDCVFRKDERRRALVPVG